MGGGGGGGGRVKGQFGKSLHFEFFGTLPKVELLFNYMGHKKQLQQLKQTYFPKFNVLKFIFFQIQCYKDRHSMFFVSVLPRTRQ